jgi:hypothetical protein
MDRVKTTPAWTGTRRKGGQQRISVAQTLSANTIRVSNVVRGPLLNPLPHLPNRS